MADSDLDAEALRAEAQRLADDPDDRAEIEAVRADMEPLRPTVDPS